MGTVSRGMAVHRQRQVRLRTSPAERDSVEVLRWSTEWSKQKMVNLLEVLCR